ncbi:MAG: hypothetical protein AMXMBFR33_50230 [Candidatus Xenobia bacterium]
MRSPGPVEYGLLLLLCLAWASIYPLVKIIEHDFEPIELMAVRALFACLSVLVVALVTRRSLRATRSQHGLLLILSFLNVTLIWIAISLAEERLSTGLTALLTALVPIGTFLLNAFVLRSERPEARRMLGLVLALVGLVVVIGPSSIVGRGADLGDLALMAAGCLGYASGGLLAAARGQGLHPLVTTVWSLAYATATLTALSFALESPLARHPQRAAWLAVLAAGVLATALPNLIYYHLIQKSGAQFASLFGYLVPVFGVLMGLFWMHEPMTVGLLPGIALTLAGVALVRR